MAVLRLLAALAAAAVLVSAGRPLKPAPGETAFCTLNAFGGNVTGTLTLTENSDGDTVITGELYGLVEGLHGFHIHQDGNLTAGCASTGAHFNPEKNDHGAGLGAGDKEAHAGDLGNIRADFFGVALVNKVYSIPLFEPGSGSLSSVVGRAIVVHELEDDLGQGDNSQPGVQGKTSKTTGNAGNRIACGVIVI